MKNFCRTLCFCLCCCSKKNQEPLIPIIDADRQIDNNVKDVNEDNHRILPKDPIEPQPSTDNQEQNEKEEKKEEQTEEIKENIKTSDNIIIQNNEPVEYYLPQYIDETLTDENVFDNKYYREDELNVKKFVKKNAFIIFIVKKDNCSINRIRI